MLDIVRRIHAHPPHHCTPGSNAEPSLRPPEQPRHQTRPAPRNRPVGSLTTDLPHGPAQAPENGPKGLLEFPLVKNGVDPVRFTKILRTGT